MLDHYPIFLFPYIHIRQDRHGYFSSVASGSIAVSTNVGSKKVCIIPNNMYTAMDGVSLFTERVKSFIQFVFPVVTASTVPAILVPAPEEGELLRLPSQEKI